MIWNNELYKTIFNKVNDAIFIHPLQEKGFANFIAVNEEAIHKYGYTEEEFLSLSASDITKKEDVERHSQPFHRKDLLSSRSMVFETIHISKDGKQFPVEISSNVVDIDGRPVIIALARDISERIKSRKIVSEHIDKFQKIFQNTPDGVILTDLEGKFYEVNPGMTVLSGYEFKDIIGKKDTDFSLWVNVEHRNEYIRELKNKGFARNKESKFRLKSGEICVGLISGEVVEIEGDKFVLSIIRDITERKRIFDALQQANENIKATLTAIPDLMFEADKSGIIYDFHVPEHKDTFVRPEEFLGKSILVTLPEDAANVILNAIAEAQIKGWHQGAVYSLLMDNTKRWYELSISLKKGIASSEDRFIILVRDISQRKNFEEILQQQNLEYQGLNTELKNTLTQLSYLNEELQIAKLKAEESDRLKTAFLGNISHEIRTPMNGIVGFVELLKSNTTLTTKELRYITIIEKSSNRLLKIINSIVEIAEIESNNLEVEKELFDPEVLFAEIYGTYLDKADINHLQFNYINELDWDRYLIRSDRQLIKRIFENLLDNAFKYTFEGSVSFGSKLYEDKILFYVSDTGQGIRKTDVNKIFDHFIQGKPVNSTVNNGAGLGLAISKAYIDAIGGEIWVESETGEGSTFYFSIPDGFLVKNEKKNNQKKLQNYKQDLSQSD